MSHKVRILAVISNQPMLAKVEGLMRRRTLEVHHASSGAGALVLGGNVSYDLVIVESPLPDLEIHDLLAAMRGLDSNSDQAGFLVLTNNGAAPEALTDRPDGPIRLVPAAAEPAAIQDAISELLGVASRRATRMLVEIEVQLGKGPSRLLYQSQNLSRSGILLRGGRRLEPGGRVRFDLALPNGESIAGQALVVRHTTSQEPIVGTALRFLDLSDEQEARILDFVHMGVATEPEPLQVASGGG